MGARPSDVRAWLLNYADKKGLVVEEDVSDIPGQRIAYTCVITDYRDESYVPDSVRAISHEGHDNALVMAFLNWSRADLDFLPLTE